MKEEDNILNHHYEENSYIEGMTKQMPYTVPLQYFESLGINVINRIQLEEEIAAIAPLLNTAGKQMPYSIPDNYFETIDFKKPVIGQGKVIHIQLWKRVLTAAVVIGVIFSSISIWNVQRKNEFPVVIQNVNTEDLMNQLDTAGLIISNTDFDDNTGTSEVTISQDDLQYASDDDLQEYMNDNIDTPFNNVDI